MRRIKELLRLAAAGRSRREIALAIGTARSTVSDYLKRAERAGLVWPLAAEWDDAAFGTGIVPAAAELAGGITRVAGFCQAPTHRGLSASIEVTVR